MLPEFLFPVGNSMQDLSRDDFSLLDGAPPSAEKHSSYSSAVATNGVSHLIATPPATPATTSYITTDSPYSQSAPRNDDGALYGSASPSAGLKCEDAPMTDLFPTHPTTWQQHPMNSREHAHLSLQQQRPSQHQREYCSSRLAAAAGGSNKLLLQSSDDPLICRGADSVTDDDAPSEFNSLLAAATVREKRQQHHPPAQHQMQQSAQHSAHHSASQQTPSTQTAFKTRPHEAQPSLPRPTNGCSLLTKQQLKLKASLMSQSQQQPQTSNRAAASSSPTRTRAANTRHRKPGAVKLRFHHQALPAEYLSHYEAQQAQAASRGKATLARLTAAAHRLPPPKTANENVRSWLQKIAEIHRGSAHQPPVHDANNNHEEVACAGVPDVVMAPAAGMKSTPTKRVVKYSDLPYMGEITLEHSKPRRGRKPKKADICHLIYKNYGTILPGTPKGKLSQPEGEMIKVEEYDGVEERVGEKELEAAAALLCRQPHDEPLNLCLRDQSAEDSCSLSSSFRDEADEEDNSLRVATSNCATPPTHSADVVNDSFLAANLDSALPSMLLEEPATSRGSEMRRHSAEPPSSAATARIWPTGDGAPTVVTSSSSPLHPMSLYYQKLIESGTLVTSAGLSHLGFPVETIQRDNQLALKIPIPSGLFLAPKQENSSPRPPPSRCAPPTAPEYPEPLSTPSSVKSENSAATSSISSLHPTTPAADVPLVAQPAPKRKRSAIYIPPMPAENTNNPSNEVSICKFKFTGGARPSLQEKKMLSVDAGGNYRYYSGTGDKSSRGYEFFPRECVQQSGGVLPGVNCPGGGGEKMPSLLDIPPPSAGLSNELLQIPDSPTDNLLLSPMTTTATATETVATAGAPVTASVAVSPLMESPNSRVTSSSTSSSNGLPLQPEPTERKKKPRRSSQREKLEKTFKEKGFLIQTQQLESAEGATYCKFRQLKKFTRYLFRNWKDYLPDELQQANEAAAAAAAAAALNQHQFHRNHQLHQNHQHQLHPQHQQANYGAISSQNIKDSALKDFVATRDALNGTRLHTEASLLHEHLTEDSRMSIVEPTLK